MKKKIFLLFVSFILQGCLYSKTAGFIVPQNAELFEEYASNGNSWYWVKIPLEIKETVHINQLSQDLMFQMPGKLKSDKSFDGQFYAILKGKSYNDIFLKKINIILVSNNISYTPNKKIYGSYASFTYPISVKDLLNKNNILLIKYDDYTKQIPIEYKVLSYQ